MNDDYNLEYTRIIDRIISHRKFQRLKKERHHTTNRFDHSIEVSYKTYIICKKLGLDYVSATKAALLHDYFFDEEFKNKTKQRKLVTHYKKSILNAKKITTLNKKEENIIASHMFPIGGKIPKSLESIIVDIVDDTVAIKEEAKAHKFQFRHLISVVLLITIGFIL